MSSLTVGRFTVDATDKADITGSDQLSISGEITESTLAAAQARRQQCLGLIGDTDQPVVPFTYTEDSTLNGFYRVASGSVTTIPVSLVVFSFKFELRLTRVPNYTQPVIEICTSGPDRADKPGGVTSAPWSAVPDDAQGYDQAGATTVYKTRTGPGGSVKWYGAAAYSGPAYGRCLIAPGDWYDMAATISVDGYPVQGRQIPGEGNEIDWIIGNGLIEVRGVGVSGGSGGSYLADLFMPNNAGTGWGTGYGLQFGWYDGSNFQNVYPAGSIYVVRNTPEECILGLRLSTHTAATNDSYSVDLHLRLRRGAFYVECYFTSNITLKHGIKTNSVVSTAAFGGSNEGMRASGDDGDGNRLVAFTTLTNTQDGNGRIYATTAAKKVNLGIGCERAGGSSVAPNRNTDLRDQYMVAASETVTIGTGKGFVS
jgi:hypothetical protein